jgi:hypothetical protein
LVFPLPPHPFGPAEEPEQFAPVAPDEPEEVARANAVGVCAPVSFDAPEQVRAAPRRKAVSACGLPKEWQHQ